MIKKIKKILCDLKLDANEIFFINYCKKKIFSGNSEFLLLQTPADYYYVCYNKLIVDKKKKKRYWSMAACVTPIKKKNFFN